MNFEKFQRTPFLQNNSGRLLLDGTKISTYVQIQKSKNNNKYHGAKSKGIALESFMLWISEKIISPKTVPAGTDLLKVDNGNTGTMEICLKITIRTLTRRQWCCSGVFVVNFEQIPHNVLVFPLLILKKVTARLQLVLKIRESDKSQFFCKNNWFLDHWKALSEGTYIPRIAPKRVFLMGLRT